MAAFSTLQDTFIGSTLNSSLWTGVFGTVVENSSGVNLQNAASYTGYNGFQSKFAYDLTGSYVLIQVVNAGNQALASLEVTPIQLQIDTSNMVWWYISSNAIAAYKKIAGTSTKLKSVAFSSATYQWLKIRESGGTTYWDYSADGITWTNFTSLANPFAVTALVAQLSLGTYAAEATATTGIYANLNTPPGGGTPTNLFFGMF